MTGGPGWLLQLLAHYGYLAVFGLVGLESAGVPLPGETMLVAAAIYAGSTGRLSLAGVLAAAISGAVLGDNAGFAVGRYGGWRLLARYGRYVRLREKDLKTGRYLFARHGGTVVFFGRFVTILRICAAFLAGANRMRWRRFAVFNAAGGITAGASPPTAMAPSCSTPLPPSACCWPLPPSAPASLPRSGCAAAGGSSKPPPRPPAPARLPSPPPRPGNPGKQSRRQSRPQEARRCARASGEPGPRRRQRVRGAARQPGCAAPMVTFCRMPRE